MALSFRITLLFSIFFQQRVMVFASATSKQCPVLVSFTTVIDEELDFIYFSLDPEMTFFEDVLGFTDNQIQHFTDDAIIFFNESYGLDFSTLPDENNERFFGNARMRPFVIKEEVKYSVVSSNWIITGNTRSTCSDVRFGALGVTFQGDQLLHGTYGGEHGILARIGDNLTYGYFIVFSCAQSPILIQFQSATPSRAEPIDGLRPVNLDTYNSVLGYGKALGYDHVTTLPGGRFRKVLRVVFTFPRN